VQYMPEQLMNRKQLLESLKRLGELLREQDIEGEILLTGGAVMCLVHSARGMTKDIDALYEPKMIINKLARQIAIEMDLPANWLNDGVKGYLTAGAQIQEFLVLDGLRILTVTPEYLLAMKLMAARHGEKDIDDIHFLLNKLQIKTFEDAMDILSEHFPADKILPKSQYVLEEYSMKMKTPKPVYKIYSKIIFVGLKYDCKSQRLGYKSQKHKRKRQISDDIMRRIRKNFV